MGYHQPSNHFGPCSEESSVQSVVTRLDTHCHSNASSGAAAKFLEPLGVPECYSHPEEVFAQAKRRGMDLVTLTDHDTIDGAMLLKDRGYPGVVVGEEVTVCFPEDRCKLHVLVWCITPELHESIGRLNLRKDVYQFAGWLSQHQLPHALAHPLYVQNHKLSPWHIDRCALLFKGFETLNGAHSGTHRKALDAYLSNLSAGRVHRLMHEHNLEPTWNRTWEKATTAGSDDHGLLNVGRTWTGVLDTSARAMGVPEGCIGRDGKVCCPREFFRVVMGARGVVGGEAGHSSLLAHQLTTVGAHYVAQRLIPKASPTGRYVASKVFRFAGAPVPTPSLLALALDQAKRKLLRKRSRLDPLVEALKACSRDVLRQYPDLERRLDPAAWTDGTPMSQHDRMASFADDLHASAHRLLALSAAKSIKNKDVQAMVDHLASYLVLELTQLPTLFSLFHQNKERRLVERIEQDYAPLHTSPAPSHQEAHSQPEGDPTQGQSLPHFQQQAPRRRPLPRPIRVMLFTDTLGDVNGVSRFIRNAADMALATGRDLSVVTSTNFQVPSQRNIINVPPVLATTMPKYENLELVLPPVVKMLRLADAMQPDVIHISTPGSVGLVGLLAAKMLRCPIVGVYHTDFPAYVDKLFQDESLTRGCSGFMRLFYSQFASIFTRSDSYASTLRAMDMPRPLLHTLRPGIMIDQFHPHFADPTIHARLPGHGSCAKPHPLRPTVRALYCGRVSVEKNMPMLARVWQKVDQRLAMLGIPAELVVVGDGPYRAQMQHDLAPTRTRFLGFRYGQELASLYASSDLFVFPSTTDTLGQVVMESQASGLPVLVCDQGGPKEVVRDGQTGFVLPASDDHAWVERMLTLLTDDQQRKAMGNAAHAFLQGFSMRESFEHYWSIHEQAWQAAQQHPSNSMPTATQTTGPATPAPTTPAPTTPAPTTVSTHS